MDYRIQAFGSPQERYHDTFCEYCNGDYEDYEEEEEVDDEYNTSG